MGLGWVSLYLVRMGIAPLLGMIMEEFHISYATAGSLFSAIFYSYTIMQLPSGYLGDRFGRRKILIFGTLLWFLLSLVTAVVQTFTALIFVRFLTGLAQGIYFGNDRPIITAATPKEKMGQGQGISFMGLALGFFLSIFAAGIIAEYFNNWRWVFVIFSIPSMITSILIFKYIQEPRRLASDGTAASIKPVYRKAFVDRDLWLMYLLGFVMLFGYWMVATWMPSIYQEIGVKGITTSSLLSGILGLIGIPGLLISGIISDIIARRGYGRKGFIALNVGIWALLMLGIGYCVGNGVSSTVISGLFFGSGLFVFGVWSPYYAFLSEMVPQDIVGTTFGFANFIGFLSAWIAPYLTGWLKDTSGSFSGGLYIAGLLLAIGVILIMAVRADSVRR
jgi:MFS family permease